MAILLKNKTANLIIVDGIEIQGNSSYKIKPFERERLSYHSDIFPHLKNSTIVLVDEAFPTIEFGGISAVQALLDSEFSRKFSTFAEEYISTYPELISLREDLTQEQQKTSYGDVSGGNYTHIDPVTGFVSFFGNAKPWKEIKFTPSTAILQGSKQPPYGLLRDTGLSYVDSGLLFNKDDKTYATIPPLNVFSFHKQSFTIGFWIEPHEPDSYILAKKDEVWAIELKGKRLKVDLEKNGSVKSENELNWKQRNCVVVSFEDTGKETKVCIYINGTLDESKKFPDQISDFINKEVYIGCEKPGKHHFDGVLDELNFWNSKLSTQDILNFYNEGKGTNNIINPSDLVASYHMNEGSGTTLNSSTNDPSLAIEFAIGNEPVWTKGLLLLSGITDGGVKCPWFSKDSVQELPFETFIDPSYVENTNLKAQIKVVPEDSSTGDVVFGLEYLWANEDCNLPTTTIIERSFRISNQQNFYLTFDFPDINGQEKQKHSLFSVRLYRNATSILDTYNARLGFLGLSFFHKMDNLGTFH